MPRSIDLFVQTTTSRSRFSRHGLYSLFCFASCGPRVGAGSVSSHCSSQSNKYSFVKPRGESGERSAPFSEVDWVYPSIVDCDPRSLVFGTGYSILIRGKTYFLCCYAGVPSRNARAALQPCRGLAPSSARHSSSSPFRPTGRCVSLVRQFVFPLAIPVIQSKTIVQKKNRHNTSTSTKSQKRVDIKHGDGLYRQRTCPTLGSVCFPWSLVPRVVAAFGYQKCTRDLLTDDALTRLHDYAAFLLLWSRLAQPGQPEIETIP